MNRKLLLVAAILVVAVAGACTSQNQNDVARTNETPRQASVSPAPTAPSAHPADPHGHDASASLVPAFQTDATSLKNLAPTLSPEKFFGQQKAAYTAVKQIPRTIAQLPCYCHCDKGFGHKSLYTCFEDDHAAHCAVCVDEALLAYRLEKDEKLKPEQIRERIIALYSARAQQ
jgi:hypothetical protein